MRKKIFLPLILTLLLVISLFNNLSKAIASDSKIVRVPKDYPTIQDAVNNANSGNIIYVDSGRYYGSITVNKPDLKIIGEDKRTTFIDFQGENGIEIIAENTWIQGFTIQGAGSSYYAINLRSNNNVIYDNILASNYGGIHCGFLFGDVYVYNNLIVGNKIYNSSFCGIYMRRACNNTILKNNFSNNHWSISVFDRSINNIIEENIILNTRNMCILLNNCPNNTVLNNYIDSAGTTGIYVDQGSNYTKVVGNFIANIKGIWGIIYVINSFYVNISNNMLFNNSAGIYLDHASYEFLSNNKLVENQYGIGVNGNVLSHFIHRIEDSNEINGKPVYYFVNERNITIDSTTYSQVGFLGIVNSTNVRIRDLQIYSNWHGLLLAYTTNSKIENLTVSNNFRGIDLMNSPSNIITYNTVINNNYGIRLLNSECAVYKNNFINNTQQVQCSVHNPVWDNSAEGNFWSSYIGEDQNKDGVGDQPYIINENNQDNFPLIEPVSFERIYFAGKWDDVSYYVTINSNSTIAGFYFDQALKRIGFNVTGPMGQIGFCNVAIPKDLLGGNYTIMVNNSTVVFLLNSNGTHNFLYFMYNCTTKNVILEGTTVITEFTMWLILPTFISLTLAAVMIKKLKTKKELANLKLQ